MSAKTVVVVTTRMRFSEPLTPGDAGNAWQAANDAQAPAMAAAPTHRGFLRLSLACCDERAIRLIQWIPIYAERFDAAVARHSGQRPNSSRRWESIAKPVDDSMRSRMGLRPSSPTSTDRPHAEHTT